MTAAVRYRSEIDGLRAIAVGSVIVNHFDHALMPSGYLGVDIFFVISGYVITLSLCARELGSLEDFLLGFYARRFKRLMPALILCVLVTAVLISLVDPDPAESLKTGFCALFGLSNLYLLHIANDYFGSPSQLNAFTHTWSLGVEEQFYLIFPLILWLLLRPSGAGARAFAAVIIALGAVSLALFATIGVHQPMAAFYLMPLRFWELAAGCVVAMFHHQRGPRQAARQRRAENAVVVLVAAVLFFPEHLALIANVAVVILTAATLATLAPGSLAYRLLASRGASYLGLISYSLYLWHWPVLVLSRYTIGLHAWSAPILIALVFIAAHLSYHRVERPLRSRSWAITNGRTVWRGAAAACIAAGLVAVLAFPLGGRIYAGKPVQLAAHNVASLSDPYRLAHTPYSWAGTNCILASNADAGKVIALDPCTLGPFAQARRRVMVFGNSFSAAFVQGFDALVRDDHYAVTITSAWGASPVGEVPNNSPWSRSNDWYWNRLLPEMTARLRPGDWVLLISDLSYLAPQQPTASDRRNLALYGAGLGRLSAALAQSGVRLAVLDANPFIRDAGCRPETALPQWFAPGGGPCQFLTKSQTVARRQSIDSLLRQLQQEHRLVVIDTLDVFCPGQSCTFLGPANQVLYRDEFSHPSVEAARAVAPLIRRALTGAPDQPPLEIKP